MSKWLTPVELVVLGAIWGGSFFFMRVCAADFGPLPLVEMRMACGALVLLPFLWPERRRFPPSLWPKLAAIAAVNSIVPFALFAWGAERAPTGIGAITNAMTVMFTALVGFMVYGEKIGRARIAGLVLGFCGVVVLASGRMGGGSVALPAAAGTLAALCYGFGINLVSRRLKGYPPAALVPALLACGAALLAPFAVAAWPHHAIAPIKWGGAFMLGALCTGVAYVLYFRLIARVGPARTATVTYLIPVFSVLWGWLLLGEPLTASMLGAGALVLGGVAMSQLGR